ncbi:MAG: hypothetical protein Q8S73_07885 [Deltaproteobacteria bacterium]|nr:hypothetical protein [Myxococcales bacterium]MDP3214008.1 hypothetical protein [Deltaproteobacteria bacterium]
MSDVLTWCAGGLVGAAVIPASASFLVEGAWRSRWRVEASRPDELRVEGQGAFRDTTMHAVVAAVERDRAPGWVRAAAWSCWFLAQMVIPGFLAWCVGLLMLSDLVRQSDPSGPVLVASFLPGAACAWLLWRAGCSLVRGERDRADRDTRRAAVVIVAYNALCLAAAVGWYLTHPRQEYLQACAAYTALSIVHALAVRAVFVAHRDQYPSEPALA